MSDDADQLPEGWAWIPPTEVTEVIRGVSYVKGEALTTPAAGYVPLLRANNIDDGVINHDHMQYVPSHRVSDQQLLRVGDVVIAMSSGSKSVVGKAAPIRAEGTATFGAFCGVLRPNPAIDDRFFGLFFQTKHYRNAVSEASAGTNINNLRREHFERLNIPLPPLAEQRRIVAKVEAVLARVNAARQRLAKVPALLKRFRQSTLAAACSGKLTADWREKHADLEAASDLIGSVRAKMKQGKVSDFIRERCGTKVDRLGLLDGRCVDSSDLPDVPASWSWLYLPQCGYMNRGKSRNRPRNAPHLYGGPFPFIQTGDIARSAGRITSHTQTYSNAGLQQSRLWPAKTICITIAANIANTALLTYEACFPDSVVGLCVEPSLADVSYVEFFLRTARDNLSQFAPATAQKNINVEILNDVAVPLPPLPEQHEIVRRVEALFALADKIEARVAAASARADKLIQATLAKAFRGELVPTEHALAEAEGRDYESAEQLLARILTTEQPCSSPPRRRARVRHHSGAGT